jgi:hypothetical protein
LHEIIKLLNIHQQQQQDAQQGIQGAQQLLQQYGATQSPHNGTHPNYAHLPQAQYGGLPGNFPLYSNLPGSDGIPPLQQFPPHHDEWQGNDGTHRDIAHSPLSAGAVAPQGTISLSFLVGSTVQLLADPTRCGVI